MEKENGFTDQRLVYALSIPGAIIYLAYLWGTSSSFLFALIGYVTLGICFGSLLSLFRLEKPYRVAVIGSSLIPLISYVFVLFLGFLYRNDITKGSIDMSGQIIPLNPFVYQEQLGKLVGMAVFIFLIFGVLSVTFGVIGLCGMFIAKGISQIVSNTPKGKKKNISGDKEVSIEKLKTIVAISTSVISGIISIVMALIK